MLNILHITNWYPSKPTPSNAPWIKNHIKALSKNVRNVVYHIEITEGKFQVFCGNNEDKSTYRIIYLPISIWVLNEVLSTLLVLWILLKNKKEKFDIINFHIAYPNCTYIHLIRKYCKWPIVITEHWSGYHFNFNIRKTEKRKRIQRIFQQNVPVITVSKALLSDIKGFSQADFPGYVAPNVVDTSVFHLPATKKLKRDMIFFMISQWKWPKDPFNVVKAWEKVIRTYPEAKLRIGGYGPQYDELHKLIRDLHLEERVELVGRLTPEQIASEMYRAKAFIHCSEYETFSVVCAEALCCGTPVIASRVGGIPEYMREEDGLLVPDNTPESFYIHIMKFLDKEELFNRADISRKMIDKFTEAKVGKIYYSAITEIISDWN